MKTDVAVYDKTIQAGKINFVFSIGLLCFIQPVSGSAEGSLIFGPLLVSPIQ